MKIKRNCFGECARLSCE